MRLLLTRVGIVGALRAAREAAAAEFRAVSEPPAGPVVRIWVMVSLLLVLGGRASAQTLGVELGYVASSLKWEPAPCDPTFGCDAQIVGPHRQSLTADFIARASLGLGLGLATGVSVTPKGYTLGGRTFRMGYIEVPFRLMLQTSSGPGLFVEGGLVPSLWATCSRSVSLFDGAHATDCDETVIEQPPPLPDVAMPRLRRLDVSWELGVGGRVSLGQGNLVAAARIRRGFLDLSPEPEGLYNRATVLVVGYEWQRPGS